MMIRELLSEIETDIKYNIYSQNKKLTTVKQVKELLNQIDFEAEVVPVEDKTKLSRLFISLKNNELSQEEIDLIDQIVETGKEKGKVYNSLHGLQA